MRSVIIGSAVLALLAGEVFAQGSGSSPAPAPAKPKVASKPAAAQPAPAGKPTTSKITFHSDSGRSCIAPCSMIVGFNEKFTAVATKPGYQSKEILVSPSLTDAGKA